MWWKLCFSHTGIQKEVLISLPGQSAASHSAAPALCAVKLSHRRVNIVRYEIWTEGTTSHHVWYMQARQTHAQNPQTMLHVGSTGMGRELVAMANTWPRESVLDALAFTCHQLNAQRTSCWPQDGLVLYL